MLLPVQPSDMPKEEKGEISAGELLSAVVYTGLLMQYIAAQ